MESLSIGTAYMRGSRGGTGARDPLKNHKNIGTISNTGLNPLKNHKATKPNPVLDHHLPFSKTPFPASEMLRGR